MVGRLRISLANMSLRLVALFLLLLAVVCLPVVDPKANERKRPQMPDIPGLDREEYKRYWEEIADSVPCECPFVNSVMCVRTLHKSTHTYTW